MELELVKKFLEKDGAENAPTINGMPTKFFEPFIIQGLRADFVEPGRVVCSMKVPPRLLNSGNSMHGGAIASLVDLAGSAAIFSVGAPSSGVSVEINVSYLDAAYAGTLCSTHFWILPRTELKQTTSPPVLIILFVIGVVYEEIEIEAKALRVGKAVAVVSVELRKKETGKVIAQGRHTKYLTVRSKM
ncbi:uncharacterized protein LOC131159359 isoform X1 [Malania oleifera]|uniref:uncharacterized protein LOC131159359 isoform X1 n=1 Tax=Malania oleifera TaxID=397392 RepID=UPI0025AE9C6A|nr:uncharacterized protein LOC131159359 isoform X1 [Malania oleifera]